jgi:hypothetical protein
MLPIAQPFVRAEIAYRQDRIVSGFARTAASRELRPRWIPRRRAGRLPGAGYPAGASSLAG